MITLDVEMIGEAQVLRRLFTFKAETDAKLGGALQRTGSRAAQMVRSMAPVDTGAYQGTISVGPLETGGDGASIRIGTGDPKGRRLELDFYGTDSLGRSFNHTSLPHPHFGPVVPLLVGMLIEEMR